MLVIGVSVRIEPSVSLVDLQTTEPLINLRKQSRKQRRPHPLTRFVHDEVLANFECHMVQVPLLAMDGDSMVLWNATACDRALVP